MQDWIGGRKTCGAVPMQGVHLSTASAMDRLAEVEMRSPVVWSIRFSWPGMRG